MKRLTLYHAGRVRHGEDGGILELLVTAGPFILSWCVLSPFLGAYTREATASQGKLALGLLPGKYTAILS